MPNFNKATATRGDAVVERGAGNGTYRPFLKKIYWKEADDERYILILNPLHDIMRLQFHPYVETDDGSGRDVAARTDKGIGERVDPLEAQWGYAPRTTDIMIAVELEPIWETKKVGNRTRESVTGFAVKTKDIQRRIRDEAGELTDDKEEVEIPEVGYIAQSPFNFGNQLNSYENTENPINLTPFKVTQVGAGSGKSYRFDGYPDAEFDLTNLLEYVENLSYVSNPDELLDLIDGLDQEDAGTIIGQYLLDLKLEEFADIEIYNEILDAVSKPSKYAKTAGDKEEKTARPKRSQRASAPVEVEVEETSDTDEPVEEVKSARTRKSAGGTQPSAKEKLEELRAAKAAKDAAASAA